MNSLKQLREVIDIQKEFRTSLTALFKEFYTGEEACAILGVSRTTLFQWRKEGLIRYRRIGKKKFVIPKEAIETFVNNSPTI